MNLNLTKDKKYITISTASKTCAEVRIVPACDDYGVPEIMRPRMDNVVYYVEHANDAFYVVTNEDQVIVPKSSIACKCI